MYSKIIGNLITKDDRLNFLTQLKNTLQEIEVNREVQPEQILSKHIKEPHLSSVLSIVEEKGIESLEEIANNIQEIESAKITLSFNPSRDQLEKMIQILRNNLNEQMFLEIEIDKSIIGGLIIYYKGKYKDYSIKKILETS